MYFCLRRTSRYSPALPLLAQICRTLVYLRSLLSGYINPFFSFLYCTACGHSQLIISNTIINFALSHLLLLFFHHYSSSSSTSSPLLRIPSIKLSPKSLHILSGVISSSQHHAEIHANLNKPFQTPIFSSSAIPAFSLYPSGTTIAKAKISHVLVLVSFNLVPLVYFY